jgi:CRP-like cAMP-binding protein
VHINGRNLLLAGLPPGEYERLHFTGAPIDQDQVLIEPFKPVRYVYFPVSGVVSFMMPAGAGQQIEAGMVGNEGVVGVCLALGSGRSPAQAVAQTGVYGMKMSAKAFRTEMERNGPLAVRVRLYAQAYLVMLAQGLVCIRAHRIEQRCARWLLMLHDRVNSESFQLTHKVLARMLGVRRATVTEVASRLQRSGLMHYQRGVMTIADPAGLEKLSCECYGIVRDELNRLLAVRPGLSRASRGSG